MVSKHFGSVSPKREETTFLKGFGRLRKRFGNVLKALMKSFETVYKLFRNRIAVTRFLCAKAFSGQFKLLKHYSKTNSKIL